MNEGFKKNPLQKEVQNDSPYAKQFFLTTSHMFSWMTYLKGHSTFLKWLVVVGCCVNFQSTLTVNTIEVVDMQRAYIQVYHKNQEYA